MCYARRQRSSWARIKLSKILYLFTLRCLNLFSSFCSSFYFCLSSILFNRIDRDFSSHYFFFALYLSLVVQFSMTGAVLQALAFWRLDYYITAKPLCQVLFQKFFQLFSSSFHSLSKTSRLLQADSFVILSLFFPFVNPFSKTFSLFSPFWNFCEVLASNCHSVCYFFTA